jgi:serine/threonine protein kinase
MHDAGRSRLIQYYHLQCSEIAAGQLRLIGVLGKGASATVYRAIWTPPRNRRGQPAPRLVAVKRFNEQVVDLQEFRTEIAINSILSHPSLMKTFGATARHPDYMIVAEYFQYGSLHDVLHGRDQVSSMSMHIHVDNSTRARD